MTDDSSISDGEKGRGPLVGGLLGAGKTTLIEKLTQWLQMHGRPVFWVTNGQGQGLLDTASAQEHLGHGSVKATFDHPVAFQPREPVPVHRNPATCAGTGAFLPSFKF